MALMFRFSEKEGVLRSVDDAPGIVAPFVSGTGFGLAISPNAEPGGPFAVLEGDMADRLTFVEPGDAVDACADGEALSYLLFALPRAAMAAGLMFTGVPEGGRLTGEMVEWLEEFQEAAEAHR